MRNDGSLNKSVWDVIVIGGGPAGMMAAATAASKGARVLLLEKNEVLGKKLSITGGGRCNITNNKPDTREMLGSYEEEGKFLFSTFAQHNVSDSLQWFFERGVAVKEENEGRLFPVTESAEAVRDAMVAELKQRKVEVLSKQVVSSVLYDSDKRIFTIKTFSETFVAKACVIATGGYARPDTGSTGDGFKWLKELGHTIEPVSDALVPVVLKSDWVKKLSGLTLSDVKVSIWSEGKRRKVKTGRVLFTHFGVTGPLILNMSKTIADLLHEGPVYIKLNLFPEYDTGAFKDYVQAVLRSNKKLQNALADILPLQFIKGVLNELAIAGDTPCHSVIKEDRTRLLQYLQAVPLSVKGLLGTDKAIVSAGGVALTEVDFRTMSSKKIPQLFVVGDMLNINRPSVGYSLQLCWSTGYAAGLHAAVWSGA